MDKVDPHSEADDRMHFLFLSAFPFGFCDDDTQWNTSPDCR